MRALHLAVVGNPDNRRVTLLREAAAALGMTEPRVVPWLEVLQGTAEFRAGELVRIDSPGEDAEVTRLLRGEPEPVDMYRVEGSRVWYEGFVKALERLHERIEGARAHALASAEDTAIAFDKARCHALLSERGISVPAAIPGIVDFKSLTASRAEHGWSEVYVKIRHGSSASGVVSVSHNGALTWAITSAELHRTAHGYELYNSLKVRHYSREQDIALLIDRLGLDGLHVEIAIRKLYIQRNETDLRLVTVGGRVTHAVGRSSSLPITNLHLGGSRRDVREFRERVGALRWGRIIELAERTAACFPRSHCLGIDVLSDTDQDYIGEVNAYGDLLPKLVGLPGTLGEGADTYTAQLASLQATYG
jgi:glutathione synthase/RimK-type ligase-like ATP-grasp enzyme